MKPMKTQKLLCVVLFCILMPVLFAEAAAPSPIDRILSASFALEDQAAVIASLTKAAAAQPPGDGRKQIFAALAGYQERLGLFDAASARYNDAAFALPMRDDCLLLDAARCALSANDVEKADGFVRAVLLTNFDEQILLRARLYAAWIRLAADDRQNAFTLLRTYAKNDAFAPWIPSILFTLWWADNDGDARSRLLASFPLSHEAAIVRGEMSLAPSPYWFLMGRPEPLVTAFNQAGTAFPPAAAATNAATATSTTTAGTSTAAPAAAAATTVATAATTTAPAAATAPGTLWQQAGFFRNREYAEERAAQLKKKGFLPVIRSETRPSGTVYFSVLISEDAQRTTGTRLKDAGFESYLVTD